MVDPLDFLVFQLKFLSGDRPFLKLNAEFLNNHTKVLLTSDSSDKLWKVKLYGGKLADGWEKFASNHNFKNGDVLVFKHYGDEIFHVSVASRSNSDIDTEDCYVDDEDGSIDVDSEYDDWEDEDNIGEDEDDEDVDVDDDDNDDDDYDDDGVEDQLGEDCCDSGKTLRKKNKKAGEGSLGNSRFITTCVTRYSLLKDRLDLPKHFTLLIGEHENLSEIDVVNEKGRKWTLKLAKNNSTGVFYVRRGWENICSTNGLSRGDVCKFKLIQNEEKPVLWLFPQESGNGYKETRPLNEVPNEKKKKKKTYSSCLEFKLTPSRLDSGQLSLRSGFTEENGIMQSREVILMDGNGRRWSSYLKITGRGRIQSFYLRRGWREMCEANGVLVNDSFVMELIWEDANPVFKFCYKIENHDNNGQVNGRTRKKRACETAPQPKNMKETSREGIEGRANQRGRACSLNRINNKPRKLQRFEQGLCSVSDQVANVKQGIVDTLDIVRHFRTEFEISEQILNASLQAIDDLGKKIMGISKILNTNLV